ncbi:aminopeptidase [Clostridium lundense]|uniref:aminopeptidase n=1 Tax=Clostridium lundense TaxID=319475 RepID=UPI000486870E|nr:aminopeptidase [Clostridium lundense]
MKKVLMGRGAKTIIEVCAKVKEKEQVLIIGEYKTKNIVESIATSVYAVGSEPTIMYIVPRERDGEEPPKTVAAAMKSSDVFICAVSKSITHTKAVKEAVNANSRGIMLTQFEEDMLISGGIEANFELASVTCKAVAKALENSKEVRLTTPSGTDLTFSAHGRRGNALTCIVSSGEFAPVPTIEANVSPLEGTAEGVIVADASIPYIGIGILKENVKIQVSKGMIIDISGGKEADILRENLALKNDPFVYNIAEMGVGLNPNCKFTGLMLEDEGVYGSVHIGIGTNITLGGNVKAACHYDLIMTKPTVIADGKVILKQGEVCI